MKSVDHLKKIFEPELEQTTLTLEEALKSPVDMIQIIGSHILRAGGKRLRPLLTLVCSKMFNPTVAKESIYLAAAVEFIHTATLVHDDVLDESDMRRGVQTANFVWGNSCSILVGDFLFARAFELMVKTGSLEILKLLSETSSVICQGEVKQLTLHHNLETTRDDYFEVITSKTASLFKAACRAGAMTTSASVNQIEALGEYGENLGKAFQVIDDLLDYTQSADSMGKSPGDDYLEGKMSLPVIELLAQKPELGGYFVDPNPESFTFIQSQIMGVSKLCEDQASAFISKACLALAPLPDSQYKTILIDLANEALLRKS